MLPTSQSHLQSSSSSSTGSSEGKTSSYITPPLKTPSFLPRSGSSGGATSLSAITLATPPQGNIETIHNDLQTLTTRINALETTFNTRITGLETTFNTRITGVETALNNNAAETNQRLDQLIAVMTEANDRRRYSPCCVIS